MFQKLVNHNDDIRRLLEKGYAIAEDSNYLIVRDIPYLDDQQQLKIGAIVTKLVDAGNDRVIQHDHQIFFAGGVPHNLDGKPIPNLGGGPTKLQLSPASSDVVVERSFSNKPTATGKFADFFDKIESYKTIISGPAMEKYGATPFTFRLVESEVPDTVFKFRDTLTSRAEIGDLAAKFKEDVVAVIGLGGTGGYILDFLMKTPVREIRGFDADPFYVHNAFRAPGRLDPAEFSKTKAEVCQGRYENFRKGLSMKSKFIDASSTEDIDGVTFAFVCVDRGPARAGIFDLLLSKNIPFIDVGMGLWRKNDGPLNGMMRMTYHSAQDGAKVRAMRLAEENEVPDGEYRNNIQISELNALNACLAVIRFKQLRGFYDEEVPYFHLCVGVGDPRGIGASELP